MDTSSLDIVKKLTCDLSQSDNRLIFAESLPQVTNSANNISNG
jgi:hypothetical protein